MYLYTTYFKFCAYKIYKSSDSKKAIENLGTASQELGKMLYEEAAKKQATSAGPSGAGQTPPPPEGEVKRKGGDDVIDAEFEAKDK